MSFLLTNDDGVGAPGIAALAWAVQPFGPAVTLAPDRHLSGCSHQATTHRPLTLSEVGENRLALDGSPVDCTRLGLTQVAPETEWVLSGINDGGNLGADVYFSGTVAAAREACLLGRRAIAISQYVRGWPVDWERAALWTRGVLELLLTRPLPAASFWNVNLPHLRDATEMPECVFCRVDPHPLPVRFVLEDGKWHYRATYSERKQTADHDIEHCFAGRIAISLVSLLAPVGAAGEIG